MAWNKLYCVSVVLMWSHRFWTVLTVENEHKYLSYIAFVVNLTVNFLNILTNFENCGHMKHTKKTITILLFWILFYAMQSKCLVSIWNATLGWNKFSGNHKVASPFVLHLFATYSSSTVTKRWKMFFISMYLLKSASGSLSLVSKLKLQLSNCKSEIR